MIDSNKIKEVVSRIATKFNPEKIILFGSHANGTPNNDSDLDLLIVQETDLPMHQRGFDIRMSLRSTMIPMDILIYTKDEFNSEKDNNFSFLNSAMKNSKVLYERAE
jgi:predicted nucleotidyltransferase